MEILPNRNRYTARYDRKGVLSFQKRVSCVISVFGTCFKQHSCRRYADIIHIRQKASITDFNGFDSINIDYSTLQYIVTNNIPSWKTALSNAKGVYLIVDTKSGKQYIGSAYGDDCIWQRWCSYAKTGHGGNAELKNLLTENGENYKYNFKYSVLEICNMNLGNEYVISRETHWKNTLMTRQFGLNKN